MTQPVAPSHPNYHCDLVARTAVRVDVVQSQCNDTFTPVPPTSESCTALATSRTIADHLQITLRPPVSLGHPVKFGDSSNTSVTARPNSQGRWPAAAAVTAVATAVEPGLYFPSPGTRSNHRKNGQITRNGLMPSKNRRMFDGNGCARRAVRGRYGCSGGCGIVAVIAVDTWLPETVRLRLSNGKIATVLSVQRKRVTIRAEDVETFPPVAPPETNKPVSQSVAAAGSPSHEPVLHCLHCYCLRTFSLPWPAPLPLPTTRPLCRDVCTGVVTCPRPPRSRSSREEQVPQRGGRGWSGDSRPDSHGNRHCIEPGVIRQWPWSGGWEDDGPSARSITSGHMCSWEWVS